MREPSLGLLLLGLLVALVLILMWTGVDPSGLQPENTAGLDDGRSSAPPAVGLQPSTERGPESGEQGVEARTALSEPQAGGALWRFVDSESGQPIPDVWVLDPQGERLASSDARGELRITPGAQDQHVFVHPGYLAGSDFPGGYPGPQEAVQDGALEWALAPDRWSPWLELEIEPSDSGEEVQVELTPSPGSTSTKYYPRVATRAFSGHLPLRLMVSKPWREQRQSRTAKLQVIPVPAPGLYRVRAIHGDRIWQKNVEFLPGQRLRLRATLQRGVMVEGVVFDLDNPSSPLFDVAVSGEVDGERVRVSTDRVGAFRFGPFPETSARGNLTFSHPAYIETSKSMVVAGTMRVGLQSQPKQDIVVRVVEAGSREPLPLAQVEVSTRGIVVPVTRPEGSAVSRASVPEIEYVLRVAHSGYIPYRRDLVPGMPQDLEVPLVPESIEDRLRLGLSARIAGIVQDAAGAPLPGVFVELRQGSDLSKLVIPPVGVRDGLVPVMMPLVATDDSGRFSFEVVRTGTWRVRCRGDGDADELSRSVALGQSVDDLVLVPQR